MKVSIIPALAALLSIPLAKAFAGELINPETGNPFKASECNSEVKIPKSQIPQGFSFESACALYIDKPNLGLVPYRPKKSEEVNMHHTQGTYFFKGGANVAGKLEYANDEYLGNRLTFSPRDRTVISPEIKFLSQEIALQRLDFKGLSGSVNCWSANAILEISSIAFLVNEKDSSGAQVAAFTAKEIDQIVKCSR